MIFCDLCLLFLKGYANDIVASPFTAWKDLAVNAVQRRIQQDRLVNAYSRWKQRQKLIKILQVKSLLYTFSQPCPQLYRATLQT